MHSKVPALHDTLSDPPEWLKSASWGLGVSGQAKWFKRWGSVGYELELGKNGPLSKATWFNHYLSLHQEHLRKRAPQRSSLLGTVRKSLCRTWTQKSGVTSSWRTRQCTPQAGAIIIEVFDSGKVVSVSLTDFLLSQQNPHWFLLPGALWALLVSVSLGKASLHEIETPHPCGEGVLQFRYHSSFSATEHRYNSTFCITTLLTSLYVLSSVNPWL